MSYGEDTWCDGSLSSSRRASGPTLVLQALFRRLITPRGTLRGGDAEESYGLDLSSYVGSVGFDVAAAALPSVVRAELFKDDRVADIAVNSSVVDNGDGTQTLELTLGVVLAESTEVFPLTLAVDSVSTQLVGGINA